MDPQSRKWRPPHGVGDEMATILLVGNGLPKEKCIHQNVIRTSKYLKQELAAWKSPMSPSIRVGWSGPDVFDTYEHWLYSRHIVTVSELRSKSRASNSEFKKSHYVELLAAWCFGKTIADELFQDMVMSALILRLGANTGQQSEFIHCLASDLINQLYNRTTEGSPIRMFIADTVARFGKIQGFQHFCKDAAYPIGFIKDIMLSTATERDRELTARKASNQGPSASAAEKKRVKFATNDLAIDDCAYHLRKKAAEACWRVTI